MIITKVINNIKNVTKFLKPEILQTTLLDNFGNYVAQRALANADETQFQRFIQIIKPIIPQLRRVSFGQKLLNKLSAQYPILSMYILNDILNMHEN